MKKLFLYCLITAFQVYAQPDFKIDPSLIQAGKYFNSEIHFFPSQKDYKVFYSYKISYSQLFFEKNGGSFNAGLRINIEILDSAGNTVKRAFDDKKISVQSFDKTNSVNEHLQGVISLELPEGNYKVMAVISDQISKRERRIPPIDLRINSKTEIFNPIVVEKSEITCNDSKAFIISNYSTAIPFNKPQNELLIPVSDTSINTINYTIKREDTVFVKDEKINESIVVSPELGFCSNNVVIFHNDELSGIKLFRIKNISSLLTEGPIKLEVFVESNTEKKKTFNLNVIWIAKPLTLAEPEEAIKLLEVIEPREVVSNLLGKKGSYSEILYDYWNQKDPTPDTKFNELMNEFYTRADYCELNFRTISGNGGIKSDRGKIYIRYGAPDTIDRNTNNIDKIVESWIYKKLNKKFLFIDKEGTGKFTLVEGQ